MISISKGVNPITVLMRGMVFVPDRMNAAAPEGTPPRRIRNKELQKPTAPPCLGEALRWEPS